MPAPRITALADDATGALEVGCRLQENGIPAEVWFVPPEQAGRSQVIDTQTRHAPPLDARDGVRRALLAAPAEGWIFKKTDSTLRGNIAAEIEGILDACACRSVVYVPAYPALGRTVVEGRLLIDGIPVEHTAFAHDPLRPVRSGVVADLFADSGLVAAPARNCAELRSLLAVPARGQVVICDASSDEEIADAAGIVAGACGEVAAAGPAVFAGAIARSLAGVPEKSPVRTGAGRGLIVNGSLHPASLQQIECAMASGIPAAADGRGAASLLGRYEWAILRPVARAGIGHAEFSEMLAQETGAALELVDADRLVLFGGESAYSILRYVNIRHTEPICEIISGVSLSHAVMPRSLWLVAKAGGFGARSLIADIVSYFGEATAG